MFMHTWFSDLSYSAYLELKARDLGLKNCQHQTPDLLRWDEKYGFHAVEFSSHDGEM